jgi:hypothetical protein
VLALAAANAVGVVLFGTLYALAGAHVLSQTAFLPCLAVLFALVTGLWVRTEARHRGMRRSRRVVTAVGGLLGVMLATPALLLSLVFWLDDQLPSEAGLHAVRGGVMAVVLIALALVVATNVVGAIVAVVRTTRAPR